MASPAAEKSTKNECGNKCQDYQDYSRINNTKFYESMKEFLEVKTPYYLIAKIINMGKNE
jgi:hypothetical protein